MDKKWGPLLTVKGISINETNYYLCLPLLLYDMLVDRWEAYAWINILKITRSPTQLGVLEGYMEFEGINGT